MKKKNKAPSNKNIKMVLIFCVFVAVAILISLTVKFFVTLSESAFDGQHQFILAVFGNQKKIKIISFAPDSMSLGILQLANAHNEDIRQALVIPIDAEVMVSDEKTTESVSPLLQDIILHFTSKKVRGMTIIDAIRLYLFSRGVGPDSIYSQTMRIPITSAQSERTIPKIFTDHSLYQEGVTISILNATNISGIGNRVAKLITNIGGNVISVATSENEENVSTIAYSKDNTYTLKRLSKILKFKTIKMQKSSLSDIIIKVGKWDGVSFK